MKHPSYMQKLIQLAIFSPSFQEAQSVSTFQPRCYQR